MECFESYCAFKYLDLFFCNVNKWIHILNPIYWNTYFLIEYSQTSRYWSSRLACTTHGGVPKRIPSLLSISYRYYIWVWWIMETHSKDCKFLCTLSSNRSRCCHFGFEQYEHFPPASALFWYSFLKIPILSKLIKLNILN